MGKKRSKGHKKPQKTSSRKSPIILVVVAFAVLAIVGSILLYNKKTAQTAQKKGVSSAGLSAPKASIPTPSERFQKLRGRWRRPDGGYIIDIRSVDAQGNLQAAYFNPRSIHVSQARASQKEGKVHIFIELTDTGYPGATYTLTFDLERDVLTGLYFQPTAGRNFDVLFSRVPSQ